MASRRQEAVLGLGRFGQTVATSTTRPVNDLRGSLRSAPGIWLVNPLATRP